MKTGILVKIIALLSGAAILFAFQNCSPKQFEQLASEPSEKSACIDEDEDCDSVNEPPTAQIPDTTPEIIEPPDLNNDQQAIAACEGAIAKRSEAVTLVSGSKIVKHHGNIFAKVSLLKKIDKSSADLMIFIPGEDNAYIRKIKRHTGNLLLCGVDVGRIDRMEGNLTAVDLSIGRVRRFRGEMELDNVSIERLKDNQISN